MAGWASGFQAGAQLGRSLIDTYQQAREQRLIQEAQQRRDEATPLPFEMPAEQAPAAPARGLTFAPQTAEQLAVGALPTMERVTPADLGLVPASSPVGAARFSYGGATKTGTVAENAPGLYRRELADIVALRNPMEAERMRAAIEQSEAAAEQRSYELSQRPTRERLTQAQLTQAELGVQTAQQQAAAQAAQRRAEETIARLISEGGDITQTQIGTIARQTGASPTFVTRAVLDQWGVSDKQVERETTSFLKELGKSAVKGEAGINEFLAKKFDPNPNDGIAPTLQKTKSGYQVVYGGQPLQGWGTYKDLNEFVADAQGRVKGDPLGAAKYILETRFKESQIRENEARAGLLGAQAGRVREMPTEKGIAPEYVVALNDINVRMGEAQARGDTKEVQRLMGEYQRTQSVALSAIGKVMPLTVGVQAPPELTKAQEDRYKELIKTDRWARLSPAQRAAELQAAGIPPSATGLPSRGDEYPQERPTSARVAAPSRLGLVPANVTPYNQDAYDAWLAAARRGDVGGAALLRGWLESNQLNRSQQQEVSRVLGLR